jgi:restriction system protein
MDSNDPFNAAAAGIGFVLMWLWPVWALIGAGLLLRLARARYERRRLAHAALPEIDRMTAAEFEGRLVVLFRALGYAVTQTGRAGNWGADLVISKGGTRTLVQAKRYTMNVGTAEVRQAVKARAKYECPAAIVVTIGYFTMAARVLARLDAVELWDRDQLIARLWETHAAAAKSPAPRAVPVPITAPDTADLDMPTGGGRPACPRCGAPMDRRTSWGVFYAPANSYNCSTFPQCRGRLPMPPTGLPRVPRARRPR